MSRLSGAIVAAVFLVMACTAPAAWAAPPPNDDFADAQTLGGPLPIEVSATNVGATRQEGEPEHAPMPSGGHSVWFGWQASSTEVVTVGTCGSGFRPIVGVYVGSDLGALAEVASNAWDPGQCVFEEGTTATFRAIAGKTYSIQVDGNIYHEPSQPPVTGEGVIKLQIHHRAAPANDDFADAQPIQLNSGGVSAPNFGATKEPGEPAPEGDPGGASVWFKFTAPPTGGALIQADGGPIGHQSLIAVYTGSSVGDLTGVPATAMWGGSALAFPVMAGVTYRIAIDGKYDPVTESPFMDEPEISLSTYPGNDDFEDAFRLGDGSLGGAFGIFGIFGLGNVGATKQPGEPDHAGNRGGSSVWFRWKAYESGSVRMNACGASFHTLVAVYTGSTLTGLTPVAASSNPPSPPCNVFGQGPYELSFNVDAGTEYRIAVDGYEGAWGSFGLEMQTSRERLASPPSEGPPASRQTSTPKKLGSGRPRTRIARRPVDSRRGAAIFHLRSNEPDSRFLCRLDSGPFAGCHATVVYKDLKAGRHTFESKALNSDGEPDHTPAVFRFDIRRR
jgi:hypothetical protein